MAAGTEAGHLVWKALAPTKLGVRNSKTKEEEENLTMLFLKTGAKQNIMVPD